MKRTALIVALSVLSVTVLITSHLGVRPVSAQSSNYTVQNIDHQVEVMYSGNVVIRDTITVSGQITDGFLIGFPYIYSEYVLKGIAFDSEEVFPMSLGVQLGERSGFYGAQVTFPTGSPQTFSVVFVLSNAILTSFSGGFYLDFPAYPSLTQPATRCNVTLVPPKGVSVTNVAKADGAVFSGNFVKDNLAAFSYFPANATIIASEGLIRQVDIATLDRIMTLGAAGEITVSDHYRISNNSTEQVNYLKLDVPVEASNIVAKDEIGALFSTALLSGGQGASVNSVNVTLTGPLRSGQSIALRVAYTLPGISPKQTHFALELEPFPYFSYYINSASIAVVPPEGAHIVMPQLSSISSSSLTLDRDLFQETVRIAREGLSYVDFEASSEGPIQIVYEYNPLWISLRPAFWVWGLAAIGSIAVVFMRRPKSSRLPKAPKVSVPKLSGGRLEPEQVKTFVDAYEEKAKLSSEVNLLIIRAQKGKIPRRQYKVQRRALELRISSLSKTISELKPTFRTAGGNYANLAKQLEAAENELSSVETNLRIAEARNRTGELSLEDYKKSISELQKRKEKAESTIKGILLRFREETR